MIPLRVNTLLFIVMLAFTQVAQALSKAEIERHLTDIEQRLKRLEGTTSTPVVLELMERLEQLQKDNAELRGTIEAQHNQIEKIKDRQRGVYLYIDRRLSELQAGAAPEAQVTEPAPAPVDEAEHASSGTLSTCSTQNPADAPELTPADPARERAEYEAAFAYLRQGRHQDAAAAFTSFLDSYPGGKYAHNAQYWLGETNYAARNFDAAIVAFARVMECYPNSSKDPDARLKLAYTHYELGEYDTARRILTEVIQKYPTSKAASLAEKRLLVMTGPDASR